jgi:hypothetical protein
VLARLKRIFKPDFQTTVTKALRQWVEAMPGSDREATSVFISGASYSPLQLLKAIEEETPVGQEVLEGLSQLQERMQAKDPKASVVDLIRRSVVREAGAASGA